MTASLIVSQETYERLLARIDTSAGPDGCHPWTGYRTSEGYGRFKIDGRLLTVTRLLLGRWRGMPLTDDEKACHHCDNPPCCNPRHLFIGSQADNQADCVAKGRRPLPPSTCRKGLHPLTPASVYVDSGTGRRRCKACHAARLKQWNAARVSA